MVIDELLLFQIMYKSKAKPVMINVRPGVINKSVVKYVTLFPYLTVADW